MQLGRFLDSPRVRRALMWAAPVLGLLSLVLLLLPGSVHVADDHATPPLVAESDPAWGLAGEENPRSALDASRRAVDAPQTIRSGVADAALLTSEINTRQAHIRAILAETN